MSGRVVLKEPAAYRCAECFRPMYQCVKKKDGGEFSVYTWCLSGDCGQYQVELKVPLEKVFLQAAD